MCSFLLHAGNCATQKNPKNSKKRFFSEKNKFWNFLLNPFCSRSLISVFSSFSDEFDDDDDEEVVESEGGVGSRRFLFFRILFLRLLFGGSGDGEVDDDEDEEFDESDDDNG